MQKTIVPRLEVTTKQYIYKYMPISEFAIRSLINNELYFNHPDNFNDPFDCTCKFYRGEEKDAISNRQYIDGYDKFFDNEESGFSKIIKDIIGICCFTEKENDFLMWAHYANGHRGICLKFEWEKDSDFFKGLKVNYSNEIPTVGHFMNKEFGPEAARATILTKLDPWAYEAEIREIIPNPKDNDRLKRFAPHSLVEIIFGEKISDYDETLIKNIINQHGKYKNLTFSRAEFNRETSQVDIKPVALGSKPALEVN